MDSAVVRSRLVERLAGSRVATIAGAGGYGKSVLIAQLADHLGLDLVPVRFDHGDTSADAIVARLAAAFRRAGLDTTVLEEIDATDALPDAVRSSLSRVEPLLVAFDDVHHLGPAEAGLLGDVIDTIPEIHRVAVAGRRLADVFGAPQVDESLLAFTADEFAELLRSAGVSVGASAADALRRSADGWSVALALAAQQLASVSSSRRRETRIDSLAEELARQPRLLAHLIEARLAAVDEATRAAIVRLAHLPLLGPPVGRCASFDDPVRDAYEALVRCGLPTVPVATGWSRLLDPVREHLTALAAPDRAVARAASAVYVRHRELTAAAECLLDAGSADEAAATLEDLPTSWLERLEVAELRAILARVPETVLDRHPRLLLQMARADSSAARSGTRAQLLERVGRLIDSVDDRERAGVIERELAGERALDLVRDGQAHEAAELVEATLRDCGPTELDARVRLLDARGRARAWAASLDSELLAAGDDLRQAASIAEQLGQARVRSQVLAALGYQVLYRLGRLDEAGDALLAAADVASTMQRQRAVVLTFAAEVLSYAGQSDRSAAILVEAANTAERLDDERLRAYVAWEQARAAAFVDDRAAVVRAVAEVERHPGDWWEHGTAMVFLAEAADWLDRVGARDLADEKLAAASSRMETLGDDPAVLVVAASLAARRRDGLAASELVERAEATEAVPPQAQWRLDLIGAAAAQLVRDPRAALLARGALDVAGRVGDGRLAERVEPALVARFRDVLSGDARPALRVRTLGAFQLLAGDEEVPVPVGQPAQLVKLLVCRGGEATVEAVIDSLWPDVDEQTGRKLLRNVLTRLRKGADELVALVERDGTRLRLARSATVDVGELLARNDVDAVELHTGEFLPDDRFVEWTEPMRARVTTHLLALCDSSGDVALLQRAIAADPYDESRYVRVARRQRDAGDVAAARRTIAAAEAALGELDLPPTRELTELRATL